MLVIPATILELLEHLIALAYRVCYYHKVYINMKKNDLILISSIMVVVAAMMIIFLIMGRNDDTSLKFQIMVQGEHYLTTDLEKEQTININDTNVLRIEEGKGQMIQADCRDQICVHHRPIDSLGEVIVCLPNRVIVSVIKSD